MESEFKTEQKTGGSKSKTIIIVLLMLALLCAGGYIAYTEFFAKKEETKTEKKKDTNTTTSTEAKEEEISLSQLENYSIIYDIVDKGIINNSMVMHLEIHNQPDYFYKQEKIYVDKMRRDVLMSMVVSYLGLQTGNPDSFRIDNDTMMKTFNKIFGDSVKYTTGNFETNNWVYKYDSEGKYYDARFASYGNVGTSFRYNKLMKVLKLKDSIEVYDLVGYNVVGRSLCKDPALKDCIDFKEEDKLKDDVDITKYQNNLNQYKYIFKLSNDGNYYFYGVEKVNK